MIRNLCKLHPHVSDGSSYKTVLLANKCYQSTLISSNLKSPFSSRNMSSVENGKVFMNRHIGPDSTQEKEMLELLGFKDLDSFIKNIISKEIMNDKMRLPQPMSEVDCLKELKDISKKNKKFRSYIGCGYYNTVTPPVILRNVLENPGWYTPYTPYQPEISQGRLELLLYYQTLVCELTGMELSNASLLDEASGCAEAATLALRYTGRKNIIVLSENDSSDPSLFEHSFSAMKTRADALGATVTVMSLDALKTHDLSTAACVMLQYPSASGLVSVDLDLIQKVKKADALAICATDPMALMMLKSPGELGFDIAFGSMQRFGVPMGFGGPHAGFFAAKSSEKFIRFIPGRIVGVTKDLDGNKCYRLTKQTREQHIRREKATSNICTAQALLANISALYAIYHGSNGLSEVAKEIHLKASLVQNILEKNSHNVTRGIFFDTLRVKVGKDQITSINRKALEKTINFKYLHDDTVQFSLDETVKVKDIRDILEIFGCPEHKGLNYDELSKNVVSQLKQSSYARGNEFLQQDIFNSIHSETQLMRFAKKLENKDISLTNSMIPLGSCTMKLNSAASMRPFLWEKFSNIHPYAPLDQTKGYRYLIDSLSEYLVEITGMDACNFQSNSGAQGEYNGLLTLRRYFDSLGQYDRKVCLIPVSAHGTNPASAALAGFDVKPIEVSENGDMKMDHLCKMLEENRDKVACVMITFPSTYGKFESSIKKICDLVHSFGGQIYMDGANMNAQVGLCKPGSFGVDVCHLNLHKTFSIPHGGGGPGMGPILVRKHLTPFLASHPSLDSGQGCISSAANGSASILTIPWMYIRMMGQKGLKKASMISVLNSNYAAKRLEPYYNILYFGNSSYNAHEFIIDLKKIHHDVGIDSIDVAKRLMDYGFHAPTVSWPLPHSVMVEPTESEDKQEIDRYCDALIKIREEIGEVESGKYTKVNNLLKNSPHTQALVTSSEWKMPYSREQAAYPLPWLRETKIWPTCRRVDDVYGDVNFNCQCN